MNKEIYYFELINVLYVISLSIIILTIILTFVLLKNISILIK